MITQDRKLRTKVLAIATQEKNNGVAEKLMGKVFATYWTELPEAQKNESSKLLFAFTQANAVGMIKMFNSPWYRFFLSYKPVEALEQIKVPVLALTGNRDWITSVKTLSVIAKALAKAGNQDCTTIEFPNLNHQFRTCETGSLQEYAMVEETIAPVVLDVISDWILKRTINKKS